MPDVVLEIAGRALAGWTSVSVRRSLAAVAGDFTLGLTEPRTAPRHQRFVIPPGAACTVRLGSQIVLRGYVDEVAPAYDKNTHTISVRGRDKTGDLVDCCHTGEECQWQDLNLLEIAERLCEPFGIPVRAEAPVGEPFAEVRYSQGTRIVEFLRSLAFKRGLLLTTSREGELIFTRAGQQRAPTALKLGENIEAARANFSNRDRYSHYLVKGQGKPDSGAIFRGLEKILEDDGQTYTQAQTDALQAKGEAWDPAIQRHRPLIIVPPTNARTASCERLAQWHAVTRAGRSRTAAYTVGGWEPAPGQLWEINQLVRVDDPFCGMLGTFLIEEVAFNLGDAGTTTTLKVIHPDAYAAKPQPQAAGKIVNSIFDGLTI